MYVAISEELVGRVRAKIATMLEAEITAAVPHLNEALSKDASELYNIAQFGEHLHLLDVIPKTWLRKVDSTEAIKVRYVTKGVTHSHEIQLRGMKSAYVVPTKGNTAFYAYTPLITEETVKAQPSSLPGRNTVLKRVNDSRLRDEITAQYAKIGKDIADLLKAAKSINEVVKLLPSFKMYLDPNDLERLDRKVSRTPREALALDIDTASITAAAVSARLANTI